MIYFIKGATSTVFPDFFGNIVSFKYSRTASNEKLPEKLVCRLILNFYCTKKNLRYALAIRGVSTAPGAIVTTRIPSDATRLAAVFVISIC